MTVRPQDLARTLVARQHRRRKLLVDRAEWVRQELEAETASFLKVHPAARAWLVGSVARGELGERSDVDVALAGVPPDGAVELSLLLGERLGVAVDVLRLEELPPSERQRFQAEGVPLHVP